MGQPSECVVAIFLVPEIICTFCLFGFLHCVSQVEIDDQVTSVNIRIFVFGSL